MTTWARIDVNLPDHVKWASLSDAAFRLGIRLTCWGNRQAHEGCPAVVTLGLVRRMGYPKLADRLIAELVQAGKPIHDLGILEPVEGGWLIHDLHNFVPSADLKAKRSAAGKRGAEKRWKPDPEAEATEWQGDGKADSKLPGACHQDPMATPARAGARATTTTTISDSASDPEGVQGEIESDPPNNERLTCCSTEFAPHPSAAAEIRKRYRLTPKALEAVVEEFVGYWTFGAGRGKKRAGWQAKFRERVRTMPPEKLEAFRVAHPQEAPPVALMVAKDSDVLTSEPPTPELVERWRTMGAIGIRLARMAGISLQPPTVPPEPSQNAPALPVGRTCPGHSDPHAPRQP